MALTMARPQRQPNSSNFYFRKTIPEEHRAFAGKAPVVPPLIRGSALTSDGLGTFVEALAAGFILLG